MTGTATVPLGLREVGAFLRARRERLAPADDAPRRRTPGLRREEVAARAGVSVDYYARLEQGRGRRPTPPVLDALARALELVEEERQHLHRLAGRAGPPAALVAAATPATHRLLQAFDHAPAVVVDALCDVLAANPAAERLLDGMASSAPEERNLLWMLFTDDARPGDLHAALVAGLRTHAAAAPDDAPAHALATRLAARSPAFAALWAEQRVAAPRHGRTHLSETVSATVADFTILALPECGQRLIAFLARE